ncbi:Gldg family protein [Thalassoglobus sp. JC818]|uniref:Gldg family protein n=1 Tax=Thalassoglobus sp. JC818 TaxID=3232136 RepID=UPI003459593B
MRSNVILAVFKRNVTSYFSGMLGYLFIVVFVVAGAFLAFNEDFFADNLANLDQLSARFPLLLLFIVPAITMTAWADEKKLGTDELLFTLPASDFEILIGKYLAVLSVYTVALIFSLTHAFVLSILGNPDWGLIFTTYLGYWLAGGALLAAGMFASVLTSSATIAFVLGTAICAIPIFIDRIPGISTFLHDTLGITEPLGVSGHLQGFTSGKVTYSGIFYFVGLTAFFLYLNSVVIARRHWAGGKNAKEMGAQYIIRTACLAIALMSLTYSLAVAGMDVDTTSEHLHTLSPTSLDILKELDDERPVTIQAFISPEVPQEYVPVRKELIDKLREYDKRGGKNIQVRFVDVEPYSEAAEEAGSLGIEPRQIQSQDNGRFSVEDVYLGVVMSSGFDTVIIPFFDRGTPIEYELTRSLGTVTTEKRRRVGILATDANVLGGFDQQSFRSQPEWQIVSELKKQYDVIEVSPDSPIEAEIDVLIAVLPSSLTQPQMDNLVAYVESGNPILVFDDPVPRFFPPGLQGAPLEAKPSPGGGMFGMQQQQGEPKADNGLATSLLDAMGLRWDVTESLFDLTNPHPRYANVFPKELIFLADTEEDPESQQIPDNPISSGLQEMIVFYPGFIERDPNTQLEFIELLRSRKSSTGVSMWDQITTPGIFGGRQLRQPDFYRADDESYVLAAMVRPEGAKSPAEMDEKKGVYGIFVADIDMINDVMFDVWQRQMYDLKIDNVLFVLNCVDYLAGDERFIELRKRRAMHRTLTALEKEKRTFEQRRSEEVEKANDEAETAVEEAKERLDGVLESLREEMQKGNVDAGAIQVRLRNAQEAENRKLAQKEKEIERAKNERVRRVRIETEQEIRKIERGFWMLGVLIPPIPAILLGVIVVVARLFSERKGISEDRLR